MFQELCIASGDVVQLILCVYTYYVVESPLFYNNHTNHEGDIIMIPNLIMGTHQATPWEVHYSPSHIKTLQYIANQFPSCFFTIIVDGKHIIGLTTMVPFAYEYF
jgi:hypothetical protein